MQSKIKNKSKHPAHVINKYSLLFTDLGMKNNGGRWVGNLHSLLN